MTGHVFKNSIERKDKIVHLKVKIKSNKYIRTQGKSDFYRYNWLRERNIDTLFSEKQKPICSSLLDGRYANKDKTLNG